MSVRIHNAVLSVLAAALSYIGLEPDATNVAANAADHARSEVLSMPTSAERDRVA